MNEQFPHDYDSTYDEFLNQPRFSEGFYLIQTGAQGDGRVIANLDHAATHIFESKGIEYFVGESGFGSAADFYSWVQQKTKLSLVDWEPVEITLFWNRYRFDEGSSEYWVWRCEQDSDSLESIAKSVFAIRHKSFVEGSEEVAPFRVAKMISYAKDVWVSKYPDKPFNLDSMDGYLDYGYYLTGVKQGEIEEKTISWPSVDLIAVLNEIEKFKVLGYSKIHLCEGDIGYASDAMDKLDIENLGRAFRKHGADCPLMDLAMVANSFTKKSNKV